MSGTQVIKPERSPVATGCCRLDAAGDVDAVGAGVDHLPSSPLGRGELMLAVAG